MWGHMWRKRIGVYPYCNKSMLVPTQAKHNSNPERTRVTTTTPTTSTPATTTTSEGSELEKYVRELEGKGRKSTELLCLLQLAVEANEKEETSF